MPWSVRSQSASFPSVPSAANRLGFTLGPSPSPPGVHVSLLLQLQGHRMGFLGVLLQLQSRVVDPMAGGRRHAAFGGLHRACWRGAVQHKPHHDDGKGHDVEPRELGGESGCELRALTDHLCCCPLPTLL